MKTLDYSGLDYNATRAVVNALQQLLADYQVYYTNLRGFHWHVKGKDFFVLHSEFEKLYDNAAEKVDEIAERILMLDGVPTHNFSEYLKISVVKETPYTSIGDEGLKHVMETQRHFLQSERKILTLASNAEDEGTVALMSGYIAEQEKLLWMLSAYYTK